MAKKPIKRLATRFIKIADFDAAHLARDDAILHRMDLLHVVDLKAVVDAYASWLQDAAELQTALPQFCWPSVYTFNTDAITVALGGPTRLDALMQFRVGHRVACPDATRDPLVYVSFLEVAPWNRRNDVGRRYRGLGVLLLQIASSWSLEKGTNGLLGLHALPAVVPFYQKLGFTQAPCPNEHHELYFEMSASRAAEFRREGGINL
jgi:GNAT superfamily N-acetyltransferase